MAKGKYTVVRATIVGLAVASVVILGTGAASSSVPAAYPPAPTGDATAAPSTAPSTPAASSTPTVAPSEPTGTLVPGEAIVTVDGVSINVVVHQDAVSGQYAITGPGFEMLLDAAAPNGVTLPLAADGSMLIVPGGDLKVTGTGFQPNSTIHLYLLSTPIDLGVFTTDANGNLNVTVALPTGVSLGQHFAQTVGTLATGDQVRLSVPLQVTNAPVTSIRKNKARVMFAVGSAKLTSNARNTLRRFVASLPTATARRIASVGYRPSSDSSASARRLAKARATVVSAYLRKLGVRGTYLISGNGVLSASAAKASRVDVTVASTVHN